MNSANPQKTYFFCGIGGSGMSPLAVILAQKGFRVLGSDRSRDQGHSPDKFKKLESLGIPLFPQDGSGVTGDVDAVIVSTAVEDSIPDVKAAKNQGISVIRRAELLASMFNEAKIGVSVAGTSGKSTVTGMIGWILTEAGRDPTVMNGGIIRNFDTQSHAGLPNMRVGRSGIFVTETDESDGSIELYNPSVAVLNNIALDHKSVEELDRLFVDFMRRATKAVVLNFDDERLRALRHKVKVPLFSYGIDDGEAGLVAGDIHFRPGGVNFDVTDRMTGRSYEVHLHVPGLHNISNAMAALAVAKALDVPLDKAVLALDTFQGIGRRLEVVGSKNNITVIDDFAHNPDKIAATLDTLREFRGRLIIVFQPHGFGPLKLMGKQIADVFVSLQGADDMVLMPEAYYAGGTVDRSVTAKDVISLIKKGGRKAEWFEKRADILPFVLEQAKPGDRIVVMGARDDTLTDFAREIVSRL